MWVLRACPVVPYEEDEITRVIDDGLDEKIYNKIKDWTVGELKAWILDNNTSTADVKALPGG